MRSVLSVSVKQFVCEFSYNYTHNELSGSQVKISVFYFNIHKISALVLYACFETIFKLWRTDNMI